MVNGIIVYALGAVADTWTTHRGIQSGRLKEANPALKWLMDRLPFDAVGDALIVKGAFLAALIVSDAPPVVFYIVGGLQFAAAFWNAYLLKREDLL